ASISPAVGSIAPASGTSTATRLTKSRETSIYHARGITPTSICAISRSIIHSELTMHPAKMAKPNLNIVTRTSDMTDFVLVKVYGPDFFEGMYPKKFFMPVHKLRIWESRIPSYQSLRKSLDIAYSGKPDPIFDGFFNIHDECTGQRFYPHYWHQYTWRPGSAIEVTREHGRPGSESDIIKQEEQEEEEDTFPEIKDDPASLVRLPSPVPPVPLDSPSPRQGGVRYSLFTEDEATSLLPYRRRARIRYESHERRSVSPLPHRKRGVRRHKSPERRPAPSESPERRTVSPLPYRKREVTRYESPEHRPAPSQASTASEVNQSNVFELVARIFFQEKTESTLISVDLNKPLRQAFADASRIALGLPENKKLYCTAVYDVRYTGNKMNWHTLNNIADFQWGEDEAPPEQYIVFVKPSDGFGSDDKKEDRNHKEDRKVKDRKVRRK
ncbi:hypothetical protein DFH27DRAFT_644997, partial [Peziza echinospora]